MCGAQRRGDATRSFCHTHEEGDCVDRSAHFRLPVLGWNLDITASKNGLFTLLTQSTLVCLAAPHRIASV